MDVTKSGPCLRVNYTAVQRTAQCSWNIARVHHLLTKRQAVEAGWPFRPFFWFQALQPPKSFRTNRALLAVLSAVHTSTAASTTSMPNPIYVTPRSLIPQLRTTKPPVIIDVREEDRRGGHIKSSLHIPAPTFRADPSKYLYLCDKSDRIIFHCMYSQVRGPTCAAVFANAIEKAMEHGSVKNVPEVVVLEGGFQAFAAAVSSDQSDLLEAFDPTLQ